MASLDELARWTGAQGVDRGQPVAITGVSGLADADESSCVFATKMEALEQALASRAGAILAAATLQEQRAGFDSDPRLLWVRDARYSFALVARKLAEADEIGSVDATAVVSASAQIGRGSMVAAGAVIGDGVRIGERCRIGPRACVLPGTSMGNDVVVQAGVILGSDGFGYVRDTATGEYLAFPQQGTLVLEDRVEVGANSTIDRGALGETRIGRGTKIDNLVHIGHNCRIGRDVVIAAQTGIAGSSVVKDGAVLGGQVGIADHVTIGEGVVLGAQAGVPTGKRLEGKGEVFWGTPARPIAQYLRDLAKLRRL